MIKEIYNFLFEIYAQWQKDKAMEMGAAIAYYTIFSLPPLLIILITLTGIFFGEYAIQGKIVAQIQGLVGKDVAITIESIIKNTHRPDISSYSAIIGIVALLLGATGVFSQVKQSLNKIWGVEPKYQSGILAFIKDKIIPFFMVLLIGFLVVLSVIVETIVSNFNEFIGIYLVGELYVFLLKISNFNISFGILTIMFALIYKVLPDVDISFRDVSLGAFVTAILFMIGKYVISLYIINTNIGLSYGTAGSMIILLVWIFYASLIFLFGAEFTQIYTKKYGKRIIPINGATIINQERFKNDKS
ncbi:MAG: YihY/virulence factor BrkB family protein [Candidatus Sericytochromatia bacterium]